MASYFTFDSDQNQVLFEAQSSVRKVSLNRPQHLNSLTYEMVSEIARALKEYENDPQVKLVIVKGKGKAFCAGGDLIRVINSIVAGHWSFAGSFYRKLLTLDYKIVTYKKPLVCLINGIIMGGGAGLCMHARFRVVTENAVFAMPEVLIGYFPDVGASYFLSRLPGYYGEYLGLTGARINGTEMLACGLATHLVLSKDILLLENALHEVASSDPRPIFELINKFTSKGDLNQDIFNKRLEVINKCFSKETVEEILSSLDHEVANGADKWVIEALSAMKSASPTSLKIFLRCIREGRKQKLEYCLTQEYTVGLQIARRTAGNDFFEGVRARLFEKDNRPKWEPSQLGEVTEEMIDKVFTKPDDEDWVDLQLPNKRQFGDRAKSKL